MHVDELKVNNNTFARYLKGGGYTVGMFGKYLNNMPSAATAGDGSTARGGTVVPAGRQSMVEGMLTWVSRPPTRGRTTHQLRERETPRALLVCI